MANKLEDDDDISEANTDDTEESGLNTADKKTRLVVML
jgi:hypothetical protein